MEGELWAREAAQVEAGANLGLLTPAAAMATFSPALWTSAQKSAPSRPGSFGPRRGPPLVLVVTPTRALALQLATACFTLVGGTNRNQGSYFPGDATSLFSYEGPKGCRVVALASDADADRESDLFLEGVSCPRCHDRTTDEQKARFAERQKQVDLARGRGESHLSDQSET